MTEADLKKQIRENSFDSVYFLYGEEGFLCDAYAKQIVKKTVTPDFEAFNYSEYYGDSLNADVLVDFCEGYPMMADKKAAFIRDFDAEKKASETEKIISLLGDPPETTVIIFANQTVSPTKSAKWKSFLKAVEAHGQTVEINRRGTSELIKILCDKAEKFGSRIDKDAAEYLIERSGDSLKALINETEKLSNFRNGESITRGDIDRLAVKTLDSSVFDMSKAMVRGNAPAAYSVLSELLDRKEEPVSILSVMSMAFVDMYRAKVASSGGQMPEKIANYYEYRGREFRLKNAGRDAQRFTAAQLRSCLSSLMAADKKLKSERTDSRTVLEQTIAKLLMITG